MLVSSDFNDISGLEGKENKKRGLGGLYFQATHNRLDDYSGQIEVSPAVSWPVLAFSGLLCPDWAFPCFNAHCPCLWRTKGQAKIFNCFHIPKCGPY